MIDVWTLVRDVNYHSAVLAICRRPTALKIMSSETRRRGGAAAGQIPQHELRPSLMTYAAIPFV